MKRIINPLIILITTIMLNSCVASRKNLVRETYPDDTILEIIRYASLAGSSHNTQPWLVDIVSDTLINVRADFSRKLHVVDPTARGLYISLGAFIENLCIASRSFGLRPEVFITAGNSSDNLAAEITLSKRGTDSFDLRKLEERTTLRKPFRKDELASEHIEKITGRRGDIHFFSASGKEGGYIASETFKAYAQQSNDEAAQHELAGWIRFSNSDVRKKRDGLTTSGMGINGFAGVIVSRIYKPEDSKKQSFIDSGIEKARLQTDNCGGWIIITQPGNAPSDWIEAGRLYQRAHLECRDIMIGFHPMNQMIETEVSEEEVNQFMRLNGRIQFVARVGYVDAYPDAVSVRRPVGEFTTDMR